jgi:hypothetical protein
MGRLYCQRARSHRLNTMQVRVKGVGSQPVSVELLVGGRGGDRDVHGSGDGSGVVIGDCHGLIAGGHQGETGESVGAGIGRGEYIERWKLGGCVGSSEVDRTVNDGVALSVVHGGDGRGEGDARNHGGGSADLEGCVGRGAATERCKCQDEGREDVKESHKEIF